ncbi:hypothetical protein CHU98_g6155 [Xylaria longipes]|nr:hypothetical protein CHU98_g6155 [Xylaria longipes]
MCRYRRSIYSCNHIHLSSEPFLTCSAQQDYISGASTEPCNIAETHTCSTVRQWYLCKFCEDKKTTLDGRLSEIKSKMTELRQHLDETYDNVMKNIDEARLKPESEGDATSEEAEEKKALDPVQAFLKAKKSEKHSQFMMLGT